MKIHDISMKIERGMPVYGGNPSKRPVFEVAREHGAGGVYETNIKMNMHTGTHVDMPLHMLEGGKTIETLDLADVVGRCRVLDMVNADEKISRTHLECKNIAAGDFVLLKTKNSYQDILENDFIYLDGTSAGYLKDKGVRGVGIDALGVERGQPGHETHKILFAAGIIVLEGLRLKDVKEGEYLLVAAPLCITGAEAAPARVFLIETAGLEMEQAAFEVPTAE